MNAEITLNTKQQRAFDKRLPSYETPEQFAARIVTEQAQTWAEADYLDTSKQLVEALKDKPQEVLDAVIDQLSSL